MDTFSNVPPGFRFHPTDEELVDYYLRKKIASKQIDLDVIKEVDLYKIEPWDLQELCKIGSEEQNDWYFFSHKDKKYPTGTRTNRATTAGFWKATGRDKAIYSGHSLVGMRKTLVFYQGRAPNGQKSDWIMHEYRLEVNEHGTPQEEGWVVCRVFKKRMTTVRKMGEYESPCWNDDQLSFMPLDGESHRRISSYHTQHYPACKQELHHQLHHHQQQNYNMPPQHHHDPFLLLPRLEIPKLPQSAASVSLPYENSICSNSNNNNNCDQAVDQVTNWRVLDNFVASQLSHGDHAAKETNFSNSSNVFIGVNDDQQMDLLTYHQSSRPAVVEQEYALTSASSCQIDFWK